MRKNKNALAITVGITAAVLSLYTMAKSPDKSPTPEQTSFEHCLLDGGETAENKSVVACCVNGKCTICGKKTGICTKRDQGSAKVTDLIQCSGKTQPAYSHSTGTMALPKKTPKPRITPSSAYRSSTTGAVVNDHRTPTSRTTP